MQPLIFPKFDVKVKFKWTNWSPWTIDPIAMMPVIITECNILNWM